MMFNPKVFHGFSVVACAVLLAACQPKAEQKEPQDQSQAVAVEQKPTEPTLQGETVAAQVTLPACEGNNCPDFTVEHLKSNFPFIDEKIDQQILKALSQILEISKSSAKAEKKSVQTTETPTTFDMQVQPYANSFIELNNELKALSGNHQINIMVKPKILQSQGALVTVVLNSSSYLGGAHGSAAQHYYHFDLKEQKQIELNDVLQSGKKAALEKLAREAFKTWVSDSKLANNIEDYEKAWPFKLSNNFLLGEQGLILQYGEYEIGPYVVGLPRLVIPYAQLQDVLKKEYLPAATTQAASTPVAKSTS